MDLTLIRNNFTKDGIFGILCDDTDFLIYTLEHAYNLFPKVPNGVYQCLRGQHSLKNGPIETFELQNVPGHTGILLHPGNYESDSEGCILLGLGIGKNVLTSSRQAFNEFMKLQGGADSFVLTVTQE